MIFACGINEAERINKMIDLELKTEQRSKKKEYKLLMLGTGESGKSTFIKQIQLLHSGFTDTERNGFVEVIRGNILDAVRDLAHAMQRFLLQDSQSLSSYIDYLTFPFNDATCSQIKEFWNDPSTQRAFQRRSEFQLSDSAEYFFRNIDRIFARDYLPTNEDIIWARAPTTGIVDYPVQLPDSIVFRMVDVGGQRSERRKWIHCFEKVTCILFMAAISEFDQQLRESKMDNRLHESLALFEVIVTEKFFMECGIILFLNKMDIFEEKIKRLSLGDYLPEFKGPSHDVNAARNFLRELFLANCPESRMDRLYTHFTCATDTEAMKFVFEAVKETVLRKILGEIMLF